MPRLFQLPLSKPIRLKPVLDAQAVAHLSIMSALLQQDDAGASCVSHASCLETQLLT